MITVHCRTEICGEKRRNRDEEERNREMKREKRFKKEKERKCFCPLSRPLGLWSTYPQYLVVAVVDALQQAGDGGLHEHEQSELPGQADHEGQHPSGLDQRPQQHVDVQGHRAPHQRRVLGQPGRDVTYKIIIRLMSLLLIYSLRFCVNVPCNLFSCFSRVIRHAG